MKALAAQHVPSNTMVELADVAETPVRVEDSLGMVSGSRDRIPMLFTQSPDVIAHNIDNLHRHVLMYKADSPFTDDFDVADFEAYCDKCHIAFQTPARGLHTCRYPGCDSFFCRRDCAQMHMSYCSMGGATARQCSCRATSSRTCERSLTCYVIGIVFTGTQGCQN